MANKITRVILVIFALSVSAFAQNNRLQGLLTASATSCSQTAQITSSCITLTMPPDAGGVSVQLSGTFSATVQFEASVDGSTWVSVPGTAVATGFPVTSATAAGIFQFPSAALVGFRIRVSSYASGAVGAVVQPGISPPAFNTVIQATTNTLATGASPTSVGAGSATAPAADLGGTLYVRTGGPNQFTCYARGVAAALTDFTQVSGGGGCGGVLAVGLKNYITDITAISTTSTGGTFRISYGTGAACASTNVALFPGNTSDTFTYPPNTAATPFQITFNQPLVTAAATRICVFGTATNTLNISINGYVAP